MKNHSGSQWYRLSPCNLNIVIADHIVRTSQSKVAHSLGEGRESLSPCISSQDPTSRRQLFCQIKQGKRIMYSNFLAASCSRAPFFNSFFLSFFLLVMGRQSTFCSCEPILLVPIVTAGTCDSSPKTFTQRNQLSGVLRKHKLQRT